MTIHNLPSADDVAFNEPVGRYLDVGEKLTATFEPVQRVTEFVLPCIAATKAPGTTYRVKVDGEEVYGPAPIPPTDIDDLTQTFLPPLRFGESLKVIIENVDGSGAQFYVQPVGWEEASD